MSGYRKLPSMTAAVELVETPCVRALAKVIVSTGLRAGIITGGIYLAGERDRHWRYGIAGAVAVEAFVLAWAFASTPRPAPAATPTPPLLPPE